MRADTSLPGAANIASGECQIRLKFYIFEGFFPLRPWVTFSRQRQFPFTLCMIFTHLFLALFLIGTFPTAIFGCLGPTLFITHVVFYLPDTSVFLCLAMAHSFHCKHKGKSVWDTHPSYQYYNSLGLRAWFLPLRPVPQKCLTPQIKPKKYQPSLWMGNYLKARSWYLWKETELLFSVVITLSISIHARFIPGMMNVIANNLSRARQILPTEWSLYQDIANIIFYQYGHSSLDLQGMRFNTNCLTFVSLTPDNRALDIDALAMSFSPQQILTQVLNKCSQMRCCTLILVAPFWLK